MSLMTMCLNKNKWFTNKAKPHTNKIQFFTFYEKKCTLERGGGLTLSGRTTKNFFCQVIFKWVFLSFFYALNQHKSDMAQPTPQYNPI